MMKKLLLGVASSFLVAGAANAEIILVNDGTDTDTATSVFGSALTVVGSNPAAEFSTPGFFGGALGNTDVAMADNSVAHQFTGLTAGGAVGGAILTIVVNEFLAGSANDRILAGDASSGATVGAALSNLNAFATTVGNTITIDLAAAGLLGVINSTGMLDVLVTDDRDVDFITLDISSVPVPAALPLMASALIGGSVAMRRRRKTA